MKHFFIFAALLASVHVQAQDTTSKAKGSFWERLNSPKVVAEEKKLPVDPATNKVSYADIVVASGASKESLTKKAKKWVAAKNSTINPYTVSYESDQEGSVIAKGTFTVPEGKKKYPVQFVIKVSTKQGKFKYDFTDFIVQFRTNAGASSGGYGGWGSSSYREAETLEYPLETFYPARLHGRKPGIKFFEEIDSDSFETINKEMQSLTASLKQAMSSGEDW